VSKFASKFNLYRYTLDRAMLARVNRGGAVLAVQVELSLPISLKAPGFPQPLSLSSEKLVSKLAFRFNLYRRYAAMAAVVASGLTRAGTRAEAPLRVIDFVGSFDRLAFAKDNGGVVFLKWN
jgi:hypothetical protein